jgi:ferrochelatase
MQKKEAIVLLNMGGPNNLEEVEMFLSNMFSDENILTMKSDLLRTIVGTMITFLRTEKSQEIYRKIGGKSPIVGLTKQLVQKLQSRVNEHVIVDFAMRYTPPFADEVIEKLNKEEVDKIYLIPLYPQFSTTTTKSSLEDFEEHYHNSSGNAILVEVKHFFENNSYNKAIVQRIKEKMGDAKCEDFDIVFSAHGFLLIFRDIFTFIVAPAHAFITEWAGFAAFGEAIIGFAAFPHNGKMSSIGRAFCHARERRGNPSRL